MVRADAEVKEDTKLKADKAAEYWRSIAHIGPHPHKLKSGYVDIPGDYKASIHVDDRTKKNKDGFTTYTVISRDYKAHWLEYGTGGSSPTPEFAFARKTEDAMNAGEV